MIIPRVLSRGTSVAAQRAHFEGVLEAAVDLPSVIYNSPYYGYETKADLFFALRARYPHLVGFKEFGGAGPLRYAAEHITGRDPSLTLMVGVDTQVFHGYVNCGATGAITGIGNVLPKEVLHLVALCEKAAAGDAEARRKALELDAALGVLSSFDEGTRPRALLQAPDGAGGQPRVRAALQRYRPAERQPEAVRRGAAETVQAPGTPTGRPGDEAVEGHRQPHRGRADADDRGRRPEPRPRQPRRAAAAVRQRLRPHSPVRGAGAARKRRHRRSAPVRVRWTRHARRA